MQISIYIRITKIVKVNVNESDSVGDVTNLLHYEEGISVFHQHLFSQDNMLMDRQKLVDYGICKSPTIHVVVEDTVTVITLRNFLL